MAESVAMDVCEANLPNGRTIRNLITANDLYGIRALLNPLTLRHRQSIVCQKVYRKTLLGHACELRFRDIVKYLLDECEADITERFINRYTWLSPLRVCFNNLDIPMFILLLNRGVLPADICEAIKCAQYVWMNKYFFIFSILRKYINAIGSMRSLAELPNLLSYLVDMDLNNEKHFLGVVASGEIDMMRTLLVDCKNRKATNNSEENALCIAILNEKSNAEHFLLNYRVFSFKAHLQALELCGAKFIVFQSNFEKGLRCWRKALRIRTEHFFGVSDKFEKKFHTDLGLEFTCEEQLDMLENQDIDIYIQALIIFLRLLSPSRVLQDTFKVIAEQPVVHNDFLQAVKILAEYAKLPNISDDKENSPIDWTMNKLESLISRHFESDPLNRRDSLLKFKHILHYTNQINWEDLLRRRGEFYQSSYIRLLKRVLYKIIYLDELKVNKVDLLSIKDGISKILQRHSDPYPTTLLHLSIEEPFAHRIIPFLIRCTDDVNCRDKLKNTPLHTASLLPASSPNHLHLIKLLVDAGGHVDAVNEFGITPFMILKSKGII